MLVAKIIKIR